MYRTHEFERHSRVKFARMDRIYIYKEREREKEKEGEREREEVAASILILTNLARSRCQ